MFADSNSHEVDAPVKAFILNIYAAVGQIKLPQTAFLEAALPKVVHSAFSLENNIAKVLAKLKTFIGQQLHRLRNNDAFHHRPREKAPREELNIVPAPVCDNGFWNLSLWPVLDDRSPLHRNRLSIRAREFEPHHEDPRKVAHPL